VTLVVDAALVVAGLVDDGPDGRWAESMLGSGDLAAPHLMPVEVANILRRAALAREISVDVASLAHRDLLGLRVELFPYEPFALRVWELRSNATAYDAWYVALAEALSAPLATLDRRLARSPGVLCAFLLPARGRTVPE
jgi:predicted nucleic acid-binding protein